MLNTSPIGKSQARLQVDTCCLYLTQRIAKLTHRNASCATAYHFLHMSAKNQTLTRCRRFHQMLDYDNAGFLDLLLLHIFWLDLQNANTSNQPDIYKTIFSIFSPEVAFFSVFHLIKLKCFLWVKIWPKRICSVYSFLTFCNSVLNTEQFRHTCFFL